MDTDNDGVISIDEFMEACRTVKLSDRIHSRNKSNNNVECSFKTHNMWFVSR